MSRSRPEAAIDAAGALDVRPTASGADVVAAASAQVVGRLRYRTCAPDGAPRVGGRRGFAEIDSYILDPAVVARLVAYADADGGPRTIPLPACTRAESRSGLLPWAVFVAVVLAAVAWSVRDGTLSLAIRLPHLVPIVIQVALYAYWSLYWGGVAVQARSLLWQIALAFALDAFLSFARFRSWRVGLSPVPIVLSANLFAWFDPTGAVIVVATAMLTKVLVRRAGRHVFNPSAAGLSAGAAYAVFAVHTSNGWWNGLFHVEHLPPNITELVLVLGLFPLVRFRLALIPLGAALGFTLPCGLVASAPNLVFPGILIAITLFASDPATTPRTAGGRLLFGLFVGLGMVAISNALLATGHPDDFSKVLPVPLANLLAPTFDRLAAVLFDRTVTRALDPRWTLLHAGLWVAAVGAFLATQKAGSFEAAAHWTYQTELVVRDADDVPRCAANPAFCRPFSLVSEVLAWRRASASLPFSPPSPPPQSEMR